MLPYCVRIGHSKGEEKQQGVGGKAGLSRTSQPRKAQAGRASRGLARLAGP
ncbi:hypothetical protein A0123_03450 [Gluconobacter cerinus]|uniref:Uncharacterized protein n=1 Tax=Gluconobacter cerinus TaxID=38307 RepID=A0A1B6VF77_9PROT|nr:hypothetical protein A0123_03450 [Gluconobacter cerinus]